MITKEMLERCQNELKQAFCALPDDVQKAIMENSKHAIYLGSNNKWFSGINPEESFKGLEHLVFRLSPDTPTEPELVEYSVAVDNRGHYELRLPNGEGSYLFAAPTFKDFLGIIYLKDGIETLRTSIDAAFGTPVRVRFSKT